VSNITHELKTPLAAIRLYAETLQQGRVRDKTESDRFLGFIHKEVVRLTALINNILDFSRIEDGKRRYTMAPANVADVVRDVVDAYSYQLRSRGFEVNFSAAAGTPTLAIDGDAIGQAVLNLIDNAVKYSADERLIDVTVESWEDGAAIRVRDRGIGIPEPEHGKIFDAFYRVEKSLQHDVKGSGLGLAVVKHVVDAHGGRVEIHSRPGEGSTFSLLIPGGARAGAGAPEEPATPAPEWKATGHEEAESAWRRRSA